MLLKRVQMFTEEGRKNKYASLYNHSTFVVVSIHSLEFDTTSESAYVTKNIESHCPIVLVVSPVEQLWSGSIYVLRSCFFVSSRNALHSILICCHQQLMNSRRSLANRKGSIHPEKGKKRKQHQWPQLPATSHLATRKSSSDKIMTK